jgi:hypothetical protein
MRSSASTKRPTSLPCSAALLVVLVAPLLWTSCNGCSPQQTVVLHYEQVGACSQFDQLHGAGPNLAFVFFRLTGVDNTKTNVDYTLKPERLWINLDPMIAQFDLVTTANLQSIIGKPPVKLTYVVPKGTNLSLNNYVVFVVETTDPDGAKEANQTNYFLLYKTQSGDPGLIPAKNNSSQTSWPYTPVCRQIQFP